MQKDQCIEKSIIPFSLLLHMIIYDTFTFAGSSLEEILAAAREQPSSVEPGLVEDESDSDEDSSSEDDERFTKEPLVTLEAPVVAPSVVPLDVVEDEDSSSEDAEEDAFQFIKKEDQIDEVDNKAEVIILGLQWV